MRIQRRGAAAPSAADRDLDSESNVSWSSVSPSSAACLSVTVPPTAAYIIQGVLCPMLEVHSDWEKFASSVIVSVINLLDPEELNILR